MTPWELWAGSILDHDYFYDWPIMTKFSSLSCPAKFHRSMATNNPDSYQQKVTKFGKILAFVSDNAIILQEKCFVKFFLSVLHLSFSFDYE